LPNFKVMDYILKQIHVLSQTFVHQRGARCKEVGGFHSLTGLSK
jgi:hypothetical protein